MRKIFLGLIVFLALFQAFTPWAVARTGYVSDRLVLTFRKGPGKNFDVVKSLTSDTRVTVLEEKNNFLNIRLDSGETGWVQKKYIVFTQPKSMIIEQLKRKNQVLQEQLESLKGAGKIGEQQPADPTGKSTEKIAELIQTIESTRKTNKDLNVRLMALQKEYSAFKEQSGKVQKIIEKSKVLANENRRLSNKVQNLEDQTGYLFRPEMIKWFLAGVGVLLLGWFFGHSISFKKKRRNSLLD